jgi:hypothetical protein
MNRLLILLFSSFIFLGCNEKRKSDLVNNYEVKKAEINQVKIKSEKLIPKTYGMRILFHSSNNIDLSVWKKNENPKKREYLFSQREMNPFKFDESKNNKNEYLAFETLKEKLNWTNNTFKKIEELLDNANCIGFDLRLNRKNEKRFEITYGYNYPGVYSYILFENNLLNNEIEEYNDGCYYVYAEKNVVFHYVGGAFGMQCFEDYERK